MPIVDANGNSIPEKTFNIKIHSVNIPMPTDDAEQLFKSARIPIYAQLQISPEQQFGVIKGHQPGMDAAVAFVAIETANAIGDLKKEIEGLRKEIAELRGGSDESDGPDGPRGATDE